MKSLFEIEKRITEAWSIIDDLKDLPYNEEERTDYINSVRTVYQQKFKLLWEAYEIYHNEQFSIQKFEEMLRDIPAERRVAVELMVNKEREWDPYLVDARYGLPEGYCARILAM